MMLLLVGVVGLAVVVILTLAVGFIVTISEDDRDTR